MTPWTPMKTTSGYLIYWTLLKKHNHPSVFTPYALSANINFEAVMEHPTGYQYELLPQTYQKLADKD
jgi:hypothetical protein